MFAVVVTFTLHPGAGEAFMPLMLANARASLADEPGCQQFDVCTDPSAPEIVFLYEIYDDEAAFQAHLATPHFKAFDRDTVALVASKVLHTYARVDR